ncbi:hypothetical protein AB0M20_06115 [Actinoplanes sp. NPDC051633]|uniref:hypothetical protein n=1 Tax=Actinoplanes sp. NPDC051633 TaxID=3155670 RepID=UPI0034197AD8
MNKTRRIGAMVAATLAATGIAATVASAPAAARPQPHNDGPRAISQFLGSVEEGELRRVAVWFGTDERVCDFKLQVRDTRSVDVWHNDGRTSSLSRDDTLQRRERDYATFRVRADEVRRSSLAILPATIWYRDCDRFGDDDRFGNDDNDVRDGRDGRDGRDRNRNRWESKSFGLLLRIEDNDRRR